MGVRLIDDAQFTIGKYGIRSIPSPDYETRVAIKKKHGTARRYAGGIFLYQKILLENSNLAKPNSISYVEG